MRKIAVVLALVWGVAAPSVVLSEDAGSLPSVADIELPIVRSMTGEFGGKQVSYTASMSRILVRDGAGAPGASLVSTSYVADHEGTSQRPVVFAFNGGPIVPSVYLHMGFFGPKRVRFDDDVINHPEKYEVIDNGASILDVADIVLFDPASTGFSRVAEGKALQDYFSVEADAQQTAAFIDAWLKREGRTGSPVYLFGESYGTIRAPEVARQLAGLEEPVLVDGVVLFGQAANIIEYAQRTANIISYVASLPTLAATAYFHDKADAKGQDLDGFLEEVRAFGQDEYLHALFLGDSLPEARKRKLAGALERYTGLSADYYIAHNLRVKKEEFRELLLADEGLLLGRSDARYVEPVSDKGRRADPSSIASNTLVKEYSGYIRQVFGIELDERYVRAAPVKGLEGWKWSGSSPFSEFAYYRPINELMDKNPDFKVFVAAGHFDTQTTAGATEYLVRQSGWPAARTTLRYYYGGHMAYSVNDSALKLADDLRAFIGGR
jgi:carboxypeptidase C (cathepsin A)